MEKIVVTIQLSMEEVDRLLQKLDMIYDDPDVKFLQDRIYQQQYPPEIGETQPGVMQYK